MRYIWRAAALILAILLILPMIAQQLPKPPPQITETIVNGQVLARRTNQPVDKARVVVRLERSVFLSNVRLHYGIETDRDGRFVVIAKTPFEPNEITVDAINSSDEFGSAKFVDKPVAIKLGSQHPLDCVNYEHFCGEQRWGGMDQIIFPDVAWEIRTAEQIEIGDPDPTLKKNRRP